MPEQPFLILAQGTADEPPTVRPAQPPVERPGAATDGTTQQPATPGGPGSEGDLPPPSPRSGIDTFFLPLMIAVIAILFFVSTGGQRREKKRREAMLSALKKGDKVLTIGGQLGTVVEIRENEVVLKTDENTNARARFTRNAIQSVQEEKQPETKEPA